MLLSQCEKTTLPSDPPEGNRRKEDGNDNVVSEEHL